MKIIRIVFIFLWIAAILGAIPDTADAKRWACTADIYATDDTQCSGSPSRSVLTCQDSDLKTQSCTLTAGQYFKASCTDCGDAGCSDATGKCNPPATVQTTPSISLSADFTRLPADASTKTTITATESNRRNGVLIKFDSNINLYYDDSDRAEKTATCTTKDGICQITVISGIAGIVVIKANAITQEFTYEEGKITITFDSRPSSPDQYLEGLIEFSPSSAQVNQEVTARSALGTIYNGKSFQLKEGSCETGIVRGANCQVTDGKCSAKFTPSNAKDYPLRFCDGIIDTKHVGSLTVGSLVTLKIIRPEGLNKIVALTDKFDFLTTFPEWPGDEFKITIQYSTDGGVQFKNLKNWEGKGIGSSAFTRNGNTITANIIIADNDLKDIGQYLFRVVPTQVGSGVPSNVAPIKFEAKCKRGDPTIEFTSGPKPIVVPFGKEVKPDKPLEFKFYVKNNDEDGCKLFDPVFSDFGVKVKDFCEFDETKETGKKESCGLDLKNVKLTPEKRQALPQEKSVDAFTLTVDIGPQTYPPILPTRTFIVKLEAEHHNIEEIWLDPNKNTGIKGIGKDNAVIKVERGVRECKRGFPLVSIVDAGGPGKDLNSPGGTQVLPGETLSYTAYVINTDFAECGPSTFKFDGINLPPNEKRGKGKWEFTPLLHAVVPDQIKPSSIEFTDDDIEFTIEGCQDGKQFNECPYKSFKFNLKSDPETKPGVRKGFTICFKNENSRLDNCGPPPDDYKNKLEQLDIVYKDWDKLTRNLPSQAHPRYSGSCGEFVDINKPANSCEFLVSTLPDEDKIPPKIDVRLSPEKPYPGAKVKFLITTSDNVQMKQIKLAIDKGFIAEDMPLKDPEEHVTIHEAGPFVKREIKHNYYAIAKDWKHEEGNIRDNIACFPEQPDKTCPDPNSAKMLKEFDIEDNPDLVIDSVENLVLPSGKLEAGKDLIIKIGVKNQGTKDAKDVVVKLEAFGPNSFTPIDLEPQRTPIVAKGSNQQFTPGIKLDVDGIWVIKATVDPDNKIAEADETNNVLVKYLVVKPKESIRISGKSCNLDNGCEIIAAGTCTNGKLSVATGDSFDTTNIVCKPSIEQGKAVIRWSDCGGKGALKDKKIIARAICNEGQSNDLDVLTGVPATDTLKRGVTPKGKEYGFGTAKTTFNLDSACTGGINVKGQGFERNIFLQCDSSCAEPFKDITTIAPLATNDADYRCATNKCCVKTVESIEEGKAPTITSKTGVTPKGETIKFGVTSIIYNLDSACTGGINVKGQGFERNIFLKCDSSCAEPFVDIATISVQSITDPDYKCATNKCCVKTVENTGERK